jgi:hypothetical protein
MARARQAWDMILKLPHSAPATRDLARKELLLLSKP